MNRHIFHSFLLSIGCSIILSSPTLAGEEATAPDAAQLRGWLADLNDESYERREAASRQLIAAGPSAVEALADGVLSEHAEAAWRAGCALESIAVTGDEQTVNAVAAALTRLSQTGKPGLKKLAGEIHQRQRQYRRDKAAAVIQQFGGRIVGGYGYDGGAIALADGPIFAGGIVMEIGEIAPPPLVPVPDEIDLQPADLKAPPRLEAPPELAEPPVLEVPADDPPPSLQEATDDALATPAEVAELIEGDIADPPPLVAPPPLEVVPRIELGGVEPRIIIAEEEEALLGIEDDAVPVPVPAPVPAVALEFLAIDGFVMGDRGLAFRGVSGESEPTASLTLDQNWRGGDDGLSVLPDLPEIREVSLQGTKLTDTALEHLAKLPKVTNLQIQGGSKFTAKGLWKFREAHPETTVFALGEAMLGINAGRNSGPCVLSSVFYNSGAYLAGLQQGDTITKIDGHKIRDFSDVTIAVFARKSGEKLDLEYEREGQRHQVEVLLKPRNVVELEAR